MNVLPYIYFFLASALFSMALTPLAIRLAHKVRFLDEPAHRKTHDRPVPYLGGVMVFASLGMTLALAWPLGLFSALDEESVQKVLIILACSLGMAFFGFWDDLFKVRVEPKFLGQLLWAVLFAVFGYRFEFLHIPGMPPLNLGPMAVPLTVFWMLSIVNAVNMVDGLDGLAATVLSGSLFLGCAASSLVDNPGGLVLCLAGLGAVLGFLRFNCCPARIYLGDAGSNGMGFLLAGVLVGLGQYHNHLPWLGFPAALSGQPFHYQIFLVTLLAAYPALEILLSVSRRTFHGRPVTRADKGHIHHRLVRLGLSGRVICLVALGFTFLLGGAALATIANYRGIATWMLVAAGALLGLALPLLGFLDFLKPRTLAFFRPHFLIAHHFISMQRAKLSLAESHADVLALVNQVCFEFGVQNYRILVPSDGEGRGDCHVSWERSPEDSRDLQKPIREEILSGNFSQFKDHVALETGRGLADWVFEPHSQESDLDVEHRVLVSEFMKEALSRIAGLKPGPMVVLGSPADLRSHSRVTSSMLHRRYPKEDASGPPKNPRNN